MEEMVALAGGKVTSSFVPPYHLIPHPALRALAMRFHLGIQKRPDGTAWNALSHNQEVLDDIQFVINRLGHAVHHAVLLIEKLQNRDVKGIQDDDDAAAIMFAGACAACAVDRMLGRQCNDEPNTASG